MKDSGRDKKEILTIKHATIERVAERNEKSSGREWVLPTR